MRMYDIITKKKRGQGLTDQEIDFFVRQYVSGEIPDYQMSALLMAIYFQGMTAEETARLTLAMALSGDRVDLSAIAGIKVDKHSTGGVGDKTTLIVAPIIAACGLPIAKMSGRGLGHTGGTIDKLEAITGFCAELDSKSFVRQVNDIKMAIIGQSGNLTPADKKMYSLRDVTATVDSIPLIASSIMSKKIAAGADVIVLDVKVGSGAFMKTLPEAEELARLMVQIGTQLGRKTAAIISDMEQPLGYTVGNAIEVLEANEILQGGEPDDLREVSIALASEILLCAGIADRYQVAHERIAEVIANGQALQTFYQFLQAQGVQSGAIDQLQQRLALECGKQKLTADASGYIHKIDAEEVGRAAMVLGAGRITKETIIDPYVGIRLTAKIGDYVQQGQVIGELYVKDDHTAALAIDKIKNGIVIGSEKVEARQRVHKIIKNNTI